VLNDVWIEILFKLGQFDAAVLSEARPTAEKPRGRSSTQPESGQPKRLSKETGCGQCCVPNHGSSEKAALPGARTFVHGGNQCLPVCKLEKRRGNPLKLKVFDKVVVVIELGAICLEQKHIESQT
jgi:hypothetical protein